MNELEVLVPLITEIEKVYKEQLKNKVNFEMKDDEHFNSIQNQTEKLHQLVIG